MAKSKAGGHRAAGGIGSKNVVRKPVRTGAGAKAKVVAGIAQLGQAQGNHITEQGATSYGGVSMRGGALDTTRSNTETRLRSMLVVVVPARVELSMVRVVAKVVTVASIAVNQCQKPKLFGQDGKNKQLTPMPAVLSEQQVVEVRQLYLTGQLSFADLAQSFGLSKSAVQCILDCRNWPYLLAQGEREALAEMRMKRRP